MKNLAAELKRHGARRDRARARALIESRAIAELAPRALAAGMTKAEICRLTGISRPALDTMLDKPAEK